MLELFGISDTTEDNHRKLTQWASHLVLISDNFSLMSRMFKKYPEPVTVTRVRSTMKQYENENWDVCLTPSI